eukprot:1702967-Alexandrium_andersonii.AAC.1
MQAQWCQAVLEPGLWCPLPFVLGRGPLAASNVVTVAGPVPAGGKPTAADWQRVRAQPSITHAEQIGQLMAAEHSRISRRRRSTALERAR